MAPWRSSTAQGAAARLARRCLPGLLGMMLGVGTLRAEELAWAPADTPVSAVSELFLEVSVNGEASGLILRFTQEGGRLSSSLDNLLKLGLDGAALGGTAPRAIALDTIAGLRYEYDATRQTLALQVDDRLRVAFAISARQTPPLPAPTVTPGAVFNYDIATQFGTLRRSAMLGELRFFNASGVFSSNGSATLTGEGKRYLRYDTYWNHSDPAALTSFQLGDLISSSLEWTRAVRMGGVQWRKNFALRPDLLTFPVASLRGSAVVPSALTLYVNEVQQYHAQVPSGPFIIDQVAGINGAGQARLVTEDALGRNVVRSLPLYVDTRLLARGLSDYSVELGALRRDYGSRSFHYGQAPVASASLRYGVDDTLTIEGHVELSGQVYNGGVGALHRLGPGVASASLAASSGASAGVQGSVGYQYIGPGFSVDAHTARATFGYTDVAGGDGSPLPRRSDRVTLNAAIGAGQSIGLSYIGARAPDAAPAAVVALSYSATLSNDMFLSLSAFRDVKDRRNRGLFASLSIALGERLSASVNSGLQNGQHSHSASVLRSADLDGGWGWGAQSGSIDRRAYHQGQLQFLGDAGQINATAQRNGGSTGGSVDVAGALVLMDSHLALTRQAGAAFAMVSTDGVPNVPVLYENRLIGMADSSGHLLLPNLNAYGNNRIDIDTTAMPIDTRLPATTMNVAPSLLSGVLARFAVERYAAASIMLRDARDQPLAPGLSVQHVGNGQRTVTGYDGLVFVDNLAEQNQLLIGEGEGQCQVSFRYPQNASGLPLIGPLPCIPVKAVP